MTDLFNESCKNNKTEVLFEQYRLYVESTQKISESRINSINIFITLNSGLIVAITAFKDSNMAVIGIGALGVILSAIAILMIQSYKKMNSVKFELICQIENHLPLFLFALEWEKLKEKRYRSFSKIECLLFGFFIFIYIAISVSAITTQSQIAVIP